jgi:formylglycine-generating enzyme required for sulfatase activity
MGSNPSHFKGDAPPVEFVSWADAQEFINKLNAKNDGYRYRLPTEAEWEYAARAGTTHEGLLETAWYRATNSNRQTHPVGQNKPNAWGLYDMLGNVAEIVDDWYGEQYYGGGAMTDPKGPSTGSFKVLRGSSWNNQASSVRVSFRGVASPANRDADSGFRLLRERS